jgi:hypothetical protein
VAGADNLHGRPQCAGLGCWRPAGQVAEPECGAVRSAGIEDRQQRLAAGGQALVGIISGGLVSHGGLAERPEFVSASLADCA